MTPLDEIERRLDQLASGGSHGKGEIVAELDLKPDDVRLYDRALRHTEVIGNGRIGP